MLDDNAKQRESREPKRSPFGDYALSLETDGKLTADLTALRQELDRYTIEAQAWIFFDIQETNIQAVLDALRNLARTVRPFHLRANELKIEGTRVRMYLGQGKNDLGNLVGKVKVSMGYSKRRKRVLLVSSQELAKYGKDIHWLIVNNYDRESTTWDTQRCRFTEALNNVKYDPSARAVGLTVWRKNEKSKMEKIETVMFSKAEKGAKVLLTEVRVKDDSVLLSINQDERGSTLEVEPGDYQSVILLEHLQKSTPPSSFTNQII